VAQTPTPVAIPSAPIINAALATKWYSHIGQNLEDTPTVAGGVVYLGIEDTCICALDAQTGKIRWQVHPPGIALSALAVGTGLVYVGAVDGRLGVSSAALYALDQQSGAMRWRVLLENMRDGYVGTPVVVDGLVYVGSGWTDYTANGGSGGRITAIDAQTGQVVWQRNTGGSQEKGIAVAADRIYVSNGTDLQHDQDSVHAIDRKTGQDRWESRVDFDVRNPVTVVDKTVYAAGENHLVALNADNGQVRWSLNSNDVDFSDPVENQGSVYVVQNAAREYCIDNCGPAKTYTDYLLILDAASGVIKTQMAMPVSPYSIDALSYYQGRLYYTDFRPSTVRAVDIQTFRTYQVFSSQNDFLAGLAISEGRLFFGTTNGEIYAVDLPK
jgi:outer membrane protein assembly factor BamB